MVGLVSMSLDRRFHLETHDRSDLCKRVPCAFAALQKERVSARARGVEQQSGVALAGGPSTIIRTTHSRRISSIPAEEGPARESSPPRATRKANPGGERVHPHAVPNETFRLKRKIDRSSPEVALRTAIPVPVEDRKLEGRIYDTEGSSARDGVSAGSTWWRRT